MVPAICTVDLVLYSPLSRLRTGNQPEACVRVRPTLARLAQIGATSIRAGLGDL